MGRWRDAFEHGRPSEQDTRYGMEYSFGPPATDQQLAATEATLGARLPADVREMLSEVNGVWYTIEVDGRNADKPSVLYLDTEYMAVRVPALFRAWRDNGPLPAEDDLQKVVFVCQSNGFACMWGVCLEDVADFRAGQVVKFDHDVSELEEDASNLYEFVRDHK